MKPNYEFPLNHHSKIAFWLKQLFFMNPRISILAIILFSFLYGCTSNISEYWDNGEMKTQIVYLGDDRSDYLYREFYATGVLKLEAQYHDKKLHGELATYFENGNLKSRTKYRHGFKHGAEILFYENGSVKSESSYQKSKLKHKTEYKTNDKYITK
jgi:antitoxin component YwqK of YwqJK toxin-antitoxin module